MGDDAYERAMAEIRRRSQMMAGTWLRSVDGPPAGGISPDGFAPGLGVPPDPEAAPTPKPGPGGSEPVGDALG